MPQLRPFKKLPPFMRTKEVKKYYDGIKGKVGYFRMKRAFDFFASSFLIIEFAIPMVTIAVLIKKDSEGPVFFKQTRVTSYGKKFKIYKFRTMTVGADKKGPGVTVDGDARITKIGHILRKYRLDEIPQLFNIWNGEMSFVGTRPEIPKYVKKYKPEMYATLLMPAGLTSSASIKYKDEAKLLDGVEDVDKVYVEKVLKGKMKYNLRDVRKSSLRHDMIILAETFLGVFLK